MQCSACSDHQTGLSDYRSSELLPSALPASDDLQHVSHGEANLPRAESHLLLTEASQLRGSGSG